MWWIRRLRLADYKKSGDESMSILNTILGLFPFKPFVSKLWSSGTQTDFKRKYILLHSYLCVTKQFSYQKQRTTQQGFEFTNNHAKWSHTFYLKSSKVLTLLVLVSYSACNVSTLSRILWQDYRLPLQTSTFWQPLAVHFLKLPKSAFLIHLTTGDHYPVTELHSTITIS
jgi:hypothetical protein